MERATIVVKVPKKLEELIHEYIRMDTHMNISDFARVAFREKLNRDCPQLVDKLFEIEDEEKEKENE